MVNAIEEAAAVLYGGTPADFVPERKRLAAQARSAGDRDGAKAILALRKPTQAAFAVNLLIRSDAQVWQRISALGGELRRAERAHDAASLRELAGQRRSLVDSLARQAFQLIGVANPGASTRDEVIATLNAALADESIGAQVRDATLDKPVQWDGFGSVPLRTLSLVETPHQAPDETPPPLEDAAPSGLVPQEDDDDSHDLMAEVARAAAERKVAEQRELQIADARREVEEADQAVADAKAELHVQQSMITALERQISEARRRHGEAQQSQREAEQLSREARVRLNRLLE